MSKPFQDWATAQLSRLLPLDDESLKQVVTYTESLSKEAAAEHLKNLLGDSPQAIEYISSFNHRRAGPPGQTPPAQDASPSAVPRPQRRPPKKKANIHELPARQVEHAGDTAGGYIKKRDEDGYMSSSTTAKPKNPPPQPDAKQLPTPSKGLTPSQKPKLPPSAAGSLISDTKSPRSSSPSKPAKVNITGGPSMRGQSATLNDLDSAIRALEMQTNPALHPTADTSRRRCNCMAQRHALLSAAPNCTKCGKIVCAKEGIGPCTFCGHALLSQEDLQAMVRILKDERGRERQEANNASHKRADISRAPRPFESSSLVAAAATTTTTTAQPDAASDPYAADAERLALAKQHRDKLLKFQAENARRTRIHDEAADFETPDSGLSMWASPQERALQLKKQQKVLREQEWNARPEYEKRQTVVSIDLKGGKAVRRMQEVARPQTPDEEEEDEGVALPVERGSKGGAFSRNPLLGGLIRPVWQAGGEEADKGKERERGGKSTWRRVQDDNDDNEQWILDGGVYGDLADGQTLKASAEADR